MLLFLNCAVKQEVKQEKIPDMDLFLDLWSVITYSLKSLSPRWAAALRRLRLRLPESAPGRRWERTPDALPTRRRSAVRTVWTHKHLLDPDSSSHLCSCVLYFSFSFFYFGCRCSNSFQRLWLLIGVGTATVFSSFTPASSTLFAKYNTHTWRRKTMNPSDYLPLNSEFWVNLRVSNFLFPVWSSCYIYLSEAHRVCVKNVLHR